MPRLSKKQDRLEQIQDFIEKKCDQIPEDHDRFRLELSTIVAELDDFYQSSFYSYGGGKWLDREFEGVKYIKNKGKIEVNIGDFLSQN